MITVDTVVTAKKQYVIDNVMPSDLDEDIDEGLKKKEELISKITNESVIESNPGIQETIDTLNSQGITEEEYIEYVKGTTSIIQDTKIPDPATTTIQYCIDDGKLQKYKTNSTIELKIPSGENVEKKVTLATLTKLAGEYTDTYKMKNAYWSIIPKDIEAPEVPDFIMINYKGCVTSKDELIDSGDIANINYIRNGYTWSSLDDLASTIEKEGSIQVTIDDLTIWFNNGMIPASQPQVPNYKVTINMNEGDMMYVTEEHLNYLYYQEQWVELPKGLSELRADGTGQFVSIKIIEFSEEQAAGDENTETCTGGTYCITTQYQSTKFDTVDTNTFVYLHLTATKQQEKKQKSCSKSGNCSKQSSSCDKGQTDVAEQHNPNVNEEWLNKILDLLIKIELHPMQKSERDLANAIIMLASAPIQGVCPDGGVTGTVVCPGAAALGNLVLGQITARAWYNTVTPATGDISVDGATSIIFDAAESAVNAAVDAAISAFNDTINNTVNNAVTAAMDSADSACSSATSAASACCSACKAAGNPSLAKAVEAASSACSGACNAALSTCNENCLGTSKQLLMDFSQSICDTRMQDTGDSASLSALNDTIASATETATAGAEAAAAQLAGQYTDSVNSACASLASVVAQAYSIIG